MHGAFRKASDRRVQKLPKLEVQSIEDEKILKFVWPSQIFTDMDEERVQELIGKRKRMKLIEEEYDKQYEDIREFERKSEVQRLDKYLCNS